MGACARICAVAGRMIVVRCRALPGPAQPASPACNEHGTAPLPPKSHAPWLLQHGRTCIGRLFTSAVPHATNAGNARLATRLAQRARAARITARAPHRTCTHQSCDVRQGGDYSAGTALAEKDFLTPYGPRRAHVGRTPAVPPQQTGASPFTAAPRRQRVQPAPCSDVRVHCGRSSPSSASTRCRPPIAPKSKSNATHSNRTLGLAVLAALCALACAGAVARRSLQQ